VRRPSPQILRAVFLVLAVFWFAFNFLGLHEHSPAHTTKSADLSQLIARVETKPRSVSRVVFNPGSLQVTATLAGGNVLKANYPSDQSALALQTLLERQKVDFAAKAPSHGSAITSILVSLLPILLLAAIWIFVMRRMRGGAGGLGQIMSFGKHKASRLAPDLPKVGFKDVAGVDEAVEELQESKGFLADPR
jgi:cell division protease FtsH